MAGVQAEGSVRLTIRASGHGTRRIYEDVREGLPATLNGPYGMFDHTLGGARQIWKQLSRGLQRLGIPRHHLHSEHFAFR